MSKINLEVVKEFIRKPKSKRFIIIVSILCVIICMVLTSIITLFVAKAGPFKEYISSGWHYYMYDGKIAKYEWVKFNNEDYYVDGLGDIAKNRLIDFTYYVGDDGKVVYNNWVKDMRTGKYSYCGINGKILKNTWVPFGKDLYHIDNDGYMSKSKWIDNTYYVDENGKMLKNQLY